MRKLIKGNTKNGIATDMTLYEFITQNLGLFCYELVKKTRWSEGKIGGSIKRLIKSIYITLEKIPGRTKKLVYPMNWVNFGGGQAKKKC